MNPGRKSLNFTCPFCQENYQEDELILKENKLITPCCGQEAKPEPEQKPWERRMY